MKEIAPIEASSAIICGTLFACYIIALLGLLALTDNQNHEQKIKEKERKLNDKEDKLKEIEKQLHRVK